MWNCFIGHLLDNWYDKRDKIDKHNEDHYNLYVKPLDVSFYKKQRDNRKNQEMKRGINGGKKGELQNKYNKL